MKRVSLPTKTNSYLKGMAITSLICGIFSLILLFNIIPLLLYFILISWISASEFAHFLFNLSIAAFFVSFLLAIIGFGTGLYVITTSKVSTERKFATGGIVTSLIALIFIGCIFFYFTKVY